MLRVVDRALATVGLLPSKKVQEAVEVANQCSKELSCRIDRLEDKIRKED